MVNDENDKWTDNGDLPVNPTHGFEQLEEKLKRKNFNSQYRNQEYMSDISLGTPRSEGRGLPT